MRRLWPDPEDGVDVAALVASDARPAHADRPWLAVKNMIASLDGGVAMAGRSGALGGPADKVVFRALRGIADVVLVGAGTIRAERYGPPLPSPEQRDARRARGQAETPRVAIVSTSLELDIASRLFAEAELRPVVITCAAAPDERRMALQDAAEVIVAGEERVDLVRAVRSLLDLGARVVLGEGGPRLNGDLVSADVVDEWNLTVSPLLIAGEAGPVATAPPLPSPVPFELDRVLEGDGLLFLRHLRVQA